MKISPVTPDLLSASVIAVPPLCRHDDLTLNPDENRKLIDHLESGGVRTLLFGGNANFYNLALSEYEELIGWLAETAGPDTTVIPSIGPFYGTAMDQCAILSRSRFPTAMLLPATFPAHPAGVQKTVRDCAERAGRPLVLYIKDPAYLTPALAAELAGEGIVAFIKYAIVRDDPSDDPYLEELCDRIDPSRIVSGIGEQPAIVHLRRFGLQGFTSGCVCVAPGRSQEMLARLREGDEGGAEEIRSRFRPLEDLRNTHGPIPVLHHAVAAAGIADTGPILPMLAALDSELCDTITRAARDLLTWNLQPTS